MVGKILVAEDDAEARELLLLLLEGGEYSLLEAADGMEALDLLRAEQPDLLITDIVMPRMDGYELVRRLREDDSTAHTSVIFCSASYHEREVREMARSLGVQSTLAKPFDHKTVRTIVDATLAARSSLADTVSTPAVQVIGGAQERLSSLVAFSRRLFGHTEAEAIVDSTCHAARDILLAQCAQLVLADDEGNRHTSTASGLSTEQVERLLRTRMYTEMLQSLEKGGCALFPMVPADTSPNGGANQPGDFVSMLGVPVASVSHHYGYLCVINRIGLPGFTDEDLAVARAIAAQVAVAYENARRYQALQSEIERRAEMESEIRFKLRSGAAGRRAHCGARSRESRARSIFVFGRSRPACTAATDSRARADAARLEAADGARAADPSRTDSARRARDELADRRTAGVVEDQSHGDAPRDHVAR